MTLAGASSLPALPAAPEAPTPPKPPPPRSQPPPPKPPPKLLSSALAPLNPPPQSREPQEEAAERWSPHCRACCWAWSDCTCLSSWTLFQLPLSYFSQPPPVFLYM